MYTAGIILVHCDGNFCNNVLVEGLRNDVLRTLMIINIILILYAVANVKANLIVMQYIECIQLASF